MKTAFASPDRSSNDELTISRDIVSHLNENCNIINIIPNSVLILNKNRQIIFANQALLTYLKLDSVDPIIGLRPGELLGCLHAGSVEGGCGTSKNCIVCGAIKAVLLSQQGQPATEECRIETVNNEALDYKINTYPLDSGGEQFTIFIISDISDAKRRRALERIFFHDVLNTAGGIIGYSELLLDTPTDDIPELSKTLSFLTHHLIDEIQAQRDLLAAERKELHIQPRTVATDDIVNAVERLFSQHKSARGKNLRVLPHSENLTVHTDDRLLRRVLTNLVKNALEASAEGQEVSLCVEKKFKYFVLSVHNDAYMPRQVRLQIFKRSFSTKGVGRGLGTYSVKLLTEYYLHGKASFISTLNKGTTFFVILPLSLQNTMRKSPDSQNSELHRN